MTPEEREAEIAVMVEAVLGDEHWAYAFSELGSDQAHDFMGHVLDALLAPRKVKTEAGTVTVDSPLVERAELSRERGMRIAAIRDGDLLDDLLGERITQIAALEARLVDSVK